MRLKLFINIDRYVDDRVKLVCAISRLKKDAINQISSYIVTDKIINFENVKTMFFKLKLIFDDSDKKVIAQNKSRNLRQKNREFHTYLAEYQRFASNSDYDEEIKKSLLLNEFSDELKTALVTVELSDTIDQIVALLQKLDNKQRALLSSIRKFYISTFRSLIFTTLSSITSVAKITIIDSTLVAFVVVDFDAINMTISRYRSKVISAQKIRRISENLCMYCEEAEYYAINCALISKNKRVTVKKMTIASTNEKKEKFSS